MKKYSLIYIVSMICFLVIAPSCTDMDEDTTGQMVSNDFYADPSLIPQAVGAAYAELQASVKDIDYICDIKTDYAYHGSCV